MTRLTGSTSESIGPFSVVPSDPGGGIVRPSPGGGSSP